MVNQPQHKKRYDENEPWEQKSTMIQILSLMADVSYSELYPRVILFVCITYMLY